ncbi:hypothetical protein IscW_ISCW013253 [Ixodes scapularis]|uniref:Uncharacterized protein n=1 Tax=Ixodes scapularis TaxID=6945 RepID=B7QCM9_IXOSC|nr:hypothetical protein IscW_ISCW013253 [Ixodes scapularis]|eukprot:XP_002413293.1 hypothetical protein IscW_ISCW013253 [Ixodes scapularis]
MTRVNSSSPASSSLAAWITVRRTLGSLGVVRRCRRLCAATNLTSMHQTSLCARARWNALHGAFRGRIQCPSECYIVCLCVQVGQRLSVTLSSLWELVFHVHSLYSHFHFVNSLLRWRRHLTFCSRFCSRQNICVEQLPMLLEQMPTTVRTSLENEKVAA